MKKSDKDKYIKSFGEDSLVGLKQEHFDALKLSGTHYRNYADELFEAEFEKAFNKHKLTLVTIDEQFIEKIKISIKNDFYDLFNFSLNTYEHSEMQLKTGTDNLPNFINSLTKKDIERIKENIETLIVPMSLTTLGLFTILNDNNGEATKTILQERDQYKKQLDDFKNKPKFRYPQEMINDFWEAYDNGRNGTQKKIVEEVIMKMYPGKVKEGDKGIIAFLQQCRVRKSEPSAKP